MYNEDLYRMGVTFLPETVETEEATLALAKVNVFNDEEFSDFSIALYNTFGPFIDSSGGAGDRRFNFAQTSDSSDTKTGSGYGLFANQIIK
jgi:hypothetical protein